MLNIVRFGEFVAGKQGVSEKFWGNKFNFRYLGARMNTTPPRSNSKYVGKRGHGKSPRIKMPVEKEIVEGDDSGEELETRTKGKKVPPPPEAFQHEQPAICLNRVVLVQRSKEWFDKKPTYVCIMMD